MSDNIKIIIIHGPNLNLLGKRDKSKYGSVTMDEINQKLQNMADQFELEVEVEFFQSNHEGDIIDFLQRDSSRNSDGVVINPGALIRYAYCFRQALIDLDKPVVEIHMSDIDKTGISKKINLLDDVRIEQVTGLKEDSYYEGFKRLIKHISDNR